MDLNHIHLGTRDLAAFRAFYEGYFGFRKRRDHGDGAFLDNDEGFMRAVDPVDDVPELPGWFHLGFTLDRPEEVKELYERMEADGVRFAKDLMEFREAVVFYCLDPDGYKIEVSWYGDEGFG
ncbi:MAG: VOC family protein [Planctomycetota bacterium]|jgi:catechol 2,3-dioxygenase-like lactoylglutathione lyase family enzyme